MTEDARTDESRGDDAPPSRGGGQATVAMALGIAALATGLLPYSGMLALPLGIVALVLGLLSRHGPDRGRAIAGAITGGLGVGAAVAWVALMYAPLVGGGLFGASERTFSSSASMSGVDEDVVEARPVDPEDPSTPGEDRVEDEPDPDALEGREDDHDEVISERRPRPPRGDRLEGSGSVTADLDGEEHAFDLEACVIDDRGPDVTAHGEGDGGRVLLRVETSRLLVVVEPRGEAAIVLEGRQRGMRGSSDGGIGDRRSVTIEGEFRSPWDERSEVSGRVEIGCS